MAVAEIVDALVKAGGLGIDGLLQAMAIGRDVVNRPVMEGARGSIGVLHDERETSSADRWIAPFERRRMIGSIARELSRNHLIRAKGLGREGERHLPLFP